MDDEDDDDLDEGEPLKLSRAELRAIDSALALLESHLEWMPTLDDAGRAELCVVDREGDGFCRETLVQLVQNPQLSLGDADYARANDDLRALDQLLPRLLRLQRLGVRAGDTEMSLRSNIMLAALMGHGQLARAGKVAPLERLSRRRRR